MFVVVSVLLTIACLVPATAKLLGHPRMQKSARHFGISWRRYRLIGVAELAAAAAGALAGLWWRPLGLAAAAGMTQPGKRAALCSHLAQSSPVVSVRICVSACSRSSANAWSRLRCLRLRSQG